MVFLRQLGIVTIIALSMLGSASAEEALRYAGATTL